MNMITSAFSSALSGIYKSVEMLNKVAKSGAERDFVQDMSDLIVSEASFKANTKTMKTADEMIGSIIDTFA
jgi:flagellar hook protein FlgE